MQTEFTASILIQFTSHSTILNDYSLKRPYKNKNITIHKRYLSISSDVALVLWILMVVTGLGINGSFGDSSNTKDASSASNGAVRWQENCRICVWRLQREIPIAILCQPMHEWGGFPTYSPCVLFYLPLLS